MRVDGSSFGDEQSTRGTRPLSVILESEVAVNVILVRPKPCHWTKNDTMLEVHPTDANRLEEFRQGHLERGGCREAAAEGKLRGAWKRFPMGQDLLESLYVDD